MQEVAGPHGHLYYLLDPLDEPGKPVEKSPSPEAPPLPNHRPPSLSPIHRSNSNNATSSSSLQQHSEPFVRPKAHTFSTTTATDHR